MSPELTAVDSVKPYSSSIQKRNRITTFPIRTTPAKTTPPLAKHEGHTRPPRRVGAPRGSAGYQRQHAHHARLPSLLRMPPRDCRVPLPCRRLTRRQVDCITQGNTQSGCQLTDIKCQCTVSTKSIIAQCFADGKSTCTPADIQSPFPLSLRSKRRN